MGREVKRVALDFDYPYGKMIWKGYYNPYRGLKCQLCDGTGYSQEYKELEDQWYYNDWCKNLSQDDVQALLDEDRLWYFTRVPINEEQRLIVEEKIKQGENSLLPYNNGYIPTVEEVNKWAKSNFGHDSINRWTCVNAKAKRLGIKMNCPDCKGEGVFYPSEKYAELARNFEPIEPPVGEGYQLWSTTSEGTPYSPVFDTPEKLATWLVENKISTFAYNTATYEEWLAFINNHTFCLDMIIDKDGIRTGIHTVL